MMKYFTLIFLLFPIIVYSQNVGIGTTSPDSSAKLEIQSSNGGVLIPRLSTAERDLVSTPATGLLIFNASEGRFEYYSGSAWMPVDASTNIDQISDEDNDTKVEVERSADEDNIYFTVGGKEVLKIDTTSTNATRISFLNSKGNMVFDDDWNSGALNMHNISMGHENHIDLTTGSNNISFGNNAGKHITSGFNNVNIGVDAGKNSLFSSRNINIGERAGIESEASHNINLGKSAGHSGLGRFNIAIGQSAGALTSGESNIMIGTSAGNYASGATNIMIGQRAGIQITTDDNICIGKDAGHYSETGSSNTFIGTEAGQLTLGSGNLFFGHYTGSNVTTGEYNTCIGNLSGQYLKEDFNTHVGYNSGTLNEDGESNTSLGSYSHTSNQFGSRNTILGSYAGYNNIGSDNVLIGYQAGYDELGSNKLYISNDSLDTPLIYGEFDSKKVEINESLVINNTSNTYSSLLINQAGAGKLLVHTNGGLSVGTDDLPPSNGLRVEGLAGALSANLKVDGDGVIFRDEALKYISFGPPALLDNPATGLVNSGTQFTKTIPDNTFVWAAINLPHGAKLKRWSVYFRGGRTDIIRGQLYRKAINSNSATSLVAFADYGDESIVKHWSFNTLSEVIDNENYTYFFRLEADSPSSEMYVEGVRLAYE